MIETGSRRSSVFRLVDKVVRAYAVAALLSCGYASAAQLLGDIDEIDDEQRRGHARLVVAQATAQVLAAPSDATVDPDRALVALVAAQEALAMAAAPEPSDAHVQELLVAAAVAEAAASPLPAVYFVGDDTA